MQNKLKQTKETNLFTCFNSLLMNICLKCLYEINIKFSYMLSRYQVAVNYVA